MWIPKPGSTEKRPLGIPAVPCQTVEGAMKNVLEPIFEGDFADLVVLCQAQEEAEQALAQPMVCGTRIV